MLQGWVVVVIALAYIGLLFLVASYGDRMRIARGASSRLLIYPLSLAIYCTSWTFFGSVGLASRSGYDFLAIYIGPLAMVGLGFPLILRIVRLAKGQNITSIADFIAARYGKSQAVAATVALIAIVGMIPYIALQLKAVSASVSTILAEASPGGAAPPLLGDVALFVALAMATFAVLFGTRHTDATEHQDGLMLAIAAESIVKLMAFLAVGIFVTFVMFHGPFALVRTRARRAAHCGGAVARAAIRFVLRHDGAVAVRHRAAAAAIPRHGGGEPQRGGNPPRRLAVPRLSGADQSVRAADCARRPDDVSGRPHRRRHVRGGAAARRPFRGDRAHCLRRRPVGGDRDGDRGDGRARHHGVERHRDAVWCSSAAPGSPASRTMPASNY